MTPGECGVVLGAVLLIVAVVRDHVRALRREQELRDALAGLPQRRQRIPDDDIDTDWA